jgi:exonuclease VII small subunit
MEQAIVDRSGAYDYEEDPKNYKKARKRLQNRESAVRSRLKKRNEMEVLEEQVRKLEEQKAAVESANEEL